MGVGIEIYNPLHASTTVAAGDDRLADVTSAVEREHSRMTPDPRRQSCLGERRGRIRWMLAEGMIERPDGGEVAWAAWGDPEGRPLMVCHGTPGSRLARSANPELYERVGAQVVTFDRPGYGRSSVRRDRTVLSVADDAIAVADGLGWDRFAVLGVSGGGPHALAVALRASERTRVVGLAAGMAPPEMVDPNYLIAFNREARRRALEEGRASLEEFLAEPAARFEADPGAMLDALLTDAPAVDLVMLKQPEIRGRMVEFLHEAFAKHEPCSDLVGAHRA